MNFMQSIFRATLFGAISVFAALFASGCASGIKTTKKPMKRAAAGELQTVRHVDLRRYMGDWRVIANIPYFAE
jgi:lipocalin